MMRPAFRKFAALLLSLCLCLSLCACSDEALEQVAQILLQEWLSQQQTAQQALPSAVPELWTAPPTAKPGGSPAPQPSPPATDTENVVRGQSYSDPYDVAAYLHLYGELPPNFITKSKAQSRGWNASAGNLWEVAPGMSIGGDHFGNYEGGLPAKSGRKWKECDVNYHGGHRGAERVLYSNDGLIYYTADHYATFTRLY